MASDQTSVEKQTNAGESKQEAADDGQKGPPTPEQILSLLQSFREEYRKAVKEGDVAAASKMLVSRPASVLPLPSPEMHAINKIMFSGRQGYTGAVLVAPGMLQMFRTMGAEASWPFCGMPDLPSLADKCGGVDCYWVAWPGVDEQRVVIFLHGGGMVMGNALMTGAFLSRLSKTTNSRVLTVEYRLCPDVSAKELVDDCVAVYRHVLDNLSVKPKSVALVGASGGGQAVMLMAQAIVDRGLATPGAVWWISGEASASAEDDQVLRKEAYAADKDVMFGDPGFVEALNKTFLRREGTDKAVDGRDPTISPLYGTFEGLPPTLYWAAETEIFAGDARAMHAKAVQAGVETEICIDKHAAHCGPALDTPEALLDIAHFASFWRKANVS